MKEMTKATKEMAIVLEELCNMQTFRSQLIARVRYLFESYSINKTNK